MSRALTPRAAKLLQLTTGLPPAIYDALCHEAGLAGESLAQRARTILTSHVEKRLSLAVAESGKVTVN